jgi:hypothetical protein
MFRSSKRSPSGSSLFISLSMLLILKIIKLFKKYYQFIVVWQHMFSVLVTRTVWRREPDWILWSCPYAATYLCNGVCIQGGSGRVAGWGAAFSCTGILFLDLYGTWWLWLQFFYPAVYVRWFKADAFRSQMVVPAYFSPAHVSTQYALQAY